MCTDVVIEENTYYMILKKLADTNRRLEEMNRSLEDSNTGTAAIRWQRKSRFLR